MQDFETFLGARNWTRQRASKRTIALKETTDSIEVLPPHMRPEAFTEHITQIVYESEQHQTSHREGSERG